VVEDYGARLNPATMRGVNKAGREEKCGRWRGEASDDNRTVCSSSVSLSATAVC